MKFGLTHASWAEKYENWHKVFAWFPIRLDCGRVAWLEKVQRRWHRASPEIDYFLDNWVYRENKPERNWGIVLSRSINWGEDLIGPAELDQIKCDQRGDECKGL